MIACSCRSLVRVEIARRLTKKYLSSILLVPQSQCCFSHHTVNPKFRIEVVQVLRRDMDRSKRSKASYQWRPVSSQSSSRQCKSHQQDLMIDSENLQAVDEKNEAGIHGDQMVGDDKNISIQSVADSDEVEGLQGAQITLHGKYVTSIAATSSTLKHLSSIQACSPLIRLINKKEGARQKKIEEELGVRIMLPSSRKEDSIIIQGDSAESVSKASERMLAIIDEAVNSRNLDYTHFISLPLAIHSELVHKLYKFQNSILGISKSEIGGVKMHSSDSVQEVEMQYGDKATENFIQPEEDDSEHFKVDMQSIPLVSYPAKNSTPSALESKTYEASELGIDSSIFIKPKTFHLTVLMLKLWNKELVTAAAKVLQGVSMEVIHALDARPLCIRLKGLECMRGSFSKARVLYAPVEEIGGEERLLRACQVIIDAFVEAGLVLETDAKHGLKLHATVMNVRHRKRYPRRRSKDYFDARLIADQYGIEDWGEYLIREAHLSERFAFDQNGYYHCCASIPFSESL